MKKLRILSAALAAATLASFASVSAGAIGKNEMKQHKVGITGTFCEWGANGDPDIPMTDADGDGVYEGTVVISKVTPEMIQKQYTTIMEDSFPTGKTGVLFKVRLDGEWVYSWADYEENYERTYNSQTNCCAEAEAGKGLRINVKLDTNDPINADPDFPEEDYYTWRVSYESEIIGKTAEVTPAGNFEYEKNSDGGMTITKYKGKDKSVVVPSQIQGKNVTAIGESAFKDNTSVTDVVLPDTVTSIGNIAFRGCTSLKKMTLSKNIDFVGRDAFDDTPWLDSLPDGDVYIGKVYYMYKGDMPENTKITVKAGTKRIVSGAFTYYFSFPGGGGITGYPQLVEVSLPDSVIDMGSYSLCSNLKKINIPKGVTELDGTFNGCRSLESITIPDGVKKIGKYVFMDCGVKNIILPDSVTTLGEGAFVSPYIESVTIPASVKEIDELAFSDWRFQITIYGEKGSSAEKYANAHGMTFKSASSPLVNSSTVSAKTAQTGKSVTINCKASGGKGDYQYAVFYKKSSSSKWLKLRDFSRLTTASFSPASAAKYDIKVKAKDKSGKVVSRDLTVTFTKSLTNNSVLSSSKTTVGKAVKIMCKADGGKGEYRYAIYYKKKNSAKWLQLLAYTKTAGFSFSPVSAGNYDIKVKVKDKSGKIESKTMTLNAVLPLTNASTLAAATAKKGDKVKVRCSAKGGTGSYTYAVYYKKASKTSYTLLRDYKDTSVVTFKPAAAVKYNIKVKAKDSSGKIVSKVLTLKVTK